MIIIFYLFLLRIRKACRTHRAGDGSNVGALVKSHIASDARALRSNLNQRDNQHLQSNTGDAVSEQDITFKKGNIRSVEPDLGFTLLEGGYR